MVRRVVSLGKVAVFEADVYMELVAWDRPGSPSSYRALHTLTYKGRSVGRPVITAVAF